MPLKTADNNFGTAKIIVSAAYSDGCTHTTIASALTSASSGDTIFIRPGTYTENLTLKAGVNLTAFTCDPDTPNVTIVGKLTATFAGTATISNIRLQTNSDNFLAVTGTSNTIINLNSCFLDCTNNTGIVYSTTGASSLIRVFYCKGNLATTGIAFISQSGANRIRVEYCRLENSGVSLTASTVSAGVLTIEWSTFQNAITTSSTGQIGLLGVTMELADLTCITHGGSAESSARYCRFSSGTASSISVSVGASFISQFNNFISSNANTITGAGTLKYGINGFETNSTINTTTQTPFYNNIGKWKASGQPCFMATQNSSSTNDTGDGTVYTLGSTVDLTERFDQDSNFVPTTGTFTAPVTGRYYLQMCALITGATTMTAYEADIITSNKTYACKMQNAALAVQQFGYPFPIVCDMDAADTATAVVFTTDGGGKIDDVFGDATKAFTYFCGFQIA